MEFIRLVLTKVRRPAALVLLAGLLALLGRPCAAQVERLPSIAERVMLRTEEQYEHEVSFPERIVRDQTAIGDDSAVWDGSYIDLSSGQQNPGFTGSPYDEPYSLHLLPEGLIYRSYLAGVKEPRFAAHIVRLIDDSTIFDANLGTRVGLLRWGTGNPQHPRGFQIDAEGSAQVRLDIPEDVDVRSVDFRAGLLATWGDEFHQTKFGYYHLSSHLGDEFMMKNPGFMRVNYAKDVIILGHSIYVLGNLRLYAEAGWAFYDQISGQWEFQFGFDYAPMYATGICGAPFFAANVYLREEVNFGGNIVVQAGWAWRSDVSSPLLRMGVMYYNGESSQFSFFDAHEEQIGFGVWYDY